MEKQEWMISVEKKLTSIQKDIEFIKNRMPACEKDEIKAMVRLNRWMISIMCTAAIALVSNALSK